VDKKGRDNDASHDDVVVAETVPIRTVNRQCSSGLQAVADVAAAIKVGYYDIVKGKYAFGQFL
jgi:acetyl-CoA acetyltransferase